LGALTAARVLTATSPGAGLRGRDLGWLDYESLYWNHPEAGRSCCGISTTKHLNVSDTQFPRLAVGEDMDLLRAAAVNYINAFRSVETQTHFYRVFLAARGYSLGEILRHLGGRHPDPVCAVRPELRQFQSLAQPNCFRWFYLQKALFIMNRFVFRLATDDPDPLGKLSTPDAWRLFLLHHWDFTDEAEAAPRTLPAQYRLSLPTATSTEVADYAQDTWYPHQLLPDDWRTSPAELRRYQEAREYCRDTLRAQIDRWKLLLNRIETAKDYRPPKVVESSRAKLSPQVPYEWFPHLIGGDQRDDEARQRWLALMQEGILISAPLARRGHERDRFTEEDIPFDLRVLEPFSIPRLLEPFVLRAHFYLAEVHAT
jgi:hypothetical protein